MVEFYPLLQRGLRQVYILANAIPSLPTKAIFTVEEEQGLLKMVIYGYLMGRDK